jgi:hypothetical protein
MQSSYASNHCGTGSAYENTTAGFWTSTTFYAALGSNFVATAAWDWNGTTDFDLFATCAPTTATATMTSTASINVAIVSQTTGSVVASASSVAWQITKTVSSAPAAGVYGGGPFIETQRGAGMLVAVPYTVPTKGASTQYFVQTTITMQTSVDVTSGQLFGMESCIAMGNTGICPGMTTAQGAGTGWFLQWMDAT